ncbi:uncharacterized protein BKA78DRAFT_48684 [Phyllosticta capitalensis]|uniref:uncharacterized protein n=1 Tax=Phyllosticta capitalensis TaxID=121624 RepID=UPI00312CF931
MLERESLVADELAVVVGQGKSRRGGGDIRWPHPFRLIILGKNTQSNAGRVDYSRIGRLDDLRACLHIQVPSVRLFSSRRNPRKRVLVPAIECWARRQLRVCRAPPRARGFVMLHGAAGGRQHHDAGLVIVRPCHHQQQEHTQQYIVPYTPHGLPSRRCSG